MSYEKVSSLLLDAGMSIEELKRFAVYVDFDLNKSPDDLTAEEIFSMFKIWDKIVKGVEE